MWLLRTMIPVPDTVPCPRRELFTGKKAFAQQARPACEEASRWLTAHGGHRHAPRPHGSCKTTSPALARLSEHGPIQQRLESGEPRRLCRAALGRSREILRCGPGARQGGELGTESGTLHRPGAAGEAPRGWWLQWSC